MGDYKGKNVYEIVTERIIKLIEEAIQTGEPLPWEKPWVFANAPKNYVSQLSYRGVNTLLLEGGEYLTWSQICDLKKKNADVHLQKGCKREIVVYFNITEKAKEVTKPTGETMVETQRIPFLRYYNVYNIKYVSGVEPTPFVEYKHDSVPEAEKIISDYLVREHIKVNFVNGDKACYSPISDRITMPIKTEFPNIEGYYGTFFHELGHSSGERLNRPIRNCFGEEDYSKEELIAECTSAMLLGSIGLSTAKTEHNNAAYMRSWIQVLKDNVRMIVLASSQAQKAFDFILYGKSKIQLPSN